MVMQDISKKVNGIEVRILTPHDVEIGDIYFADACQGRFSVPVSVEGFFNGGFTWKGIHSVGAHRYESSRGCILKKDGRETILYVDEKSFEELDETFNWRVREVEATRNF